ncbi:protein phosphatase 1 regulatory subunit 3A isoform X2 [Gambusia affinis]|uniref:protein phosphatase 1 regulatory subunit 3A isoform X2 n=1 Tax=Gambusia affinis TaxID=33528 RepID=UPI001CDD4F91|nr:protein phosphatase 1 regulatory subunit 3A isoform X2 [Gambusia affinis]
MHSSADMSFLTIPSQEGLFKTIKTSKSAGEAEGRSRTDAAVENDDEEDEDDDDTEDVRLMLRCSPVPRKRGASIFDETAEYMRIHQALSAGKRVSFADTTGGDLVDVREFAAFDSDEEDTSHWQEEEAKYRKAVREPIYRVHPEFQVPSGGVLLQVVRSNKVEVERISPVEDEPLAFSGVIRVLNISFHKAVYIRSTMDNWDTYFDHPAENYAVTLHLSYEDDPAQTSTNMAQKRSILKSPKIYSLTSEEGLEKGEEEPESLIAELVRPTAVCPVIIHPEIDVEKPGHQSGPSATSQYRPLRTGATLSTPSASSELDLQANSAFALKPDNSQPSHSLHRVHEKETPEQSVHSRPAASPSPPRPSSQEPEQRSDESQTDRVETLPRFGPLSAAGDKRLAAECVSYPSLMEESPAQFSQLQKKLLETPTKSAEHQAAETCASANAGPQSASFDDPLALMSEEEDYSIDLKPCILFLGVSLSLVWWKLFGR